jgi:uncharacterized protein (DUF1697 family)
MRYAAFVRAVMVGRDGLHREALLDAFEHAGARRARSYISTGNVTFDAPPRSVPTIARRVEAAVEVVVGRRTEVYVRSIPHLEDLLAAEPYDRSPVPDTVEREVSFLYEPIDVFPLDLPIVSSGGHLTIVHATPDEVFCAGRQVDGRRRGAGGFVERILGQRVTTRAWATVQRITQDPSPVD